MRVGSAGSASVSWNGRSVAPALAATSAISSLRRRIPSAARSSPLFHGSTSVTASASPAARPRSSIASRFARGLLHGPPLHDVVDAALHDEHVGAGQDEVEPARDLIRALAVDGRRPELEPGVGAATPTTATGSARPGAGIRARTAGSGSHNGEPAEIESPATATTISATAYS